MVDLGFFQGPFLIDLFFLISYFNIGLINIICINLIFVRLLQSHDPDRGFNKFIHVNLDCYFFCFF